ncbi:MAG TPA: ATP-binding protein [Candidatus Binatia bacterium]
MGLAIVRRIVERYGGVINVRSARGEGTVFEVTLPREDGAVA